MAKRRDVFFSAFGPETKETNKPKRKFALTCNFQKVIRAVAFSDPEKFDNSFYFKILGVV